MANSAVDRKSLTEASQILLVAALVALAMGACMVLLEDGRAAVSAMGGVVEAQVPIFTAQIVLLLDILFPLAFGSGLMLFAHAFRSEENKSVIHMILLAMLVAVIADFTENSLAFKAMTGQGETFIKWPMTVIKYATIAFGGILLSALLPQETQFDKIVKLILRYIVPFNMALLICGVAGEFGRLYVGGSFPAILLTLSIYARQRT